MLSALGSAIVAGAISCALGVVNAAEIPLWCPWVASTRAVDLDGDGSMEELEVSGLRLRVRTGDELVEAPREWLVSDAQAGDLNGDGVPELVALVWRAGSYGTSHPFWLDGGDTRLCQHLFALGWREGELHPLWMSSALNAQVASMRLEDEMLYLRERSGRETTWRWEDWGFTLQE